MSNFYILEGIEHEYLLVIKAKNKDLALSIIDQLAASRKEILKELAHELEKSLNDSSSRRNPLKVRPKNKSKGSNGNPSGNRKATNTKRRSKPSA
jgi:hypothetical protein